MIIDADILWLRKALRACGRSPDPNTRVGAVIARHGVLIAKGWNTLPEGLEHTHARLHDRETKLQAIVHAELNAICGAARTGRSTEGATLYLAATDDSGLVWGGAPCRSCTKHVIQAGITRVVSFQPKAVSKWAEELAEARAWLAEAKIQLVEVPFGG